VRAARPDILTRELAQKMSGSRGQPVVVENRPAGTILGAGEVARVARPTGTPSSANHPTRTLTINFAAVHGFQVNPIWPPLA